MTTTLITGANRGIGLELARQSAAAGAHVIATCRDSGAAKDLVALAAGAGGKVEVVALDVASADSVAALKAGLGNRPIDVLINNAGIMGGDPQAAGHMDFDVLQETLNVNLFGPMRVTQSLMDNLAAAKGKAAVISSMMAQYDFGGTNKTAYCVSKTAVTRAFTMLASEVRGKGVTICILSPGWVKTDMGGSSAPLTATASAKGLLQQIGGWSLRDSGAFRDYEGREMPW